MTHEELLARIAELSITPETNVVPSQLAAGLMAVLEEHKPISHHLYFDLFMCDGCYYSSWPCPTVKVIEKEIM